MNSEPAITVASIVALVGALITLLVVFGVDITDDQRDAILGLVLVAGPIVAGLVIRQNVVSPATDAERSATAYAEGEQGAPPSVPLV